MDVAGVSPLGASPQTTGRPLRIGELAARTNVSVRSLRYYEAQGLLPAARSTNGYRHFDESAVMRVAHIQELFAAGLCSTKIADLLPFIGGAVGTIAPAPGLVADLIEAERRIDDQLRDLHATRAVLRSLLAAARHGGSTELVTSTRRPARAARGAQGQHVLPPSVDVEHRA